VAKNWFDGPIPTPEIGILGGLPSLQLTEEDKRRALAQMFLQGGLATAAASLGGANTGRALGAGLLGGADAYGQGLQAPAARMDAYSKQLKMQGDQIGNAKGMEELAKLKRDASDYASKNDFLAMLNDPGRAAMLYGGGPSVQNEQRASQFGANPAMMLSDPRMNLKALQAGVDPKQLGAALENTRPFKMEMGTIYVDPRTNAREHIPRLPEGMRLNAQNQAEAIPGFADATYTINNAQNWAKVNPEVAIKRAESDYTPMEYVGPGNARYMARRGDVLGNNPAGVKIGDSTLGGKLAEHDATYINQLRDKHDSAVQGNYLLSQLQSKIESDPGVYGGMFAKGAQGVAGFFNGLGVPFDQQRFQNSKEFEKYSDQLGMQLIKSYVGSANVSDADRQAVMSLMPRLTDDPTARQRLIQVLGGINNRNIGQYIDARQKADASGTLSGDAAKMQKPWSPSQATAADIAHTARKYGISETEVRRRLGI